MDTVKQVTATESAQPQLTWLSKTGAAAALLSGILFLIGLIGLIATVLQPGSQNGLLLSLQKNWLVVLFKLNAGSEGVQFNQLQRLDILDIVILAFVGITYLSLYAVLRRTSKVWAVVGVAQPFLGILLFIVTRNAGRSAVMGATLVIALLMLVGKSLSKGSAILGILASILLLIGDFGTAPGVHSNMLEIFIGIGYIMLSVWFFAVGRKLLEFS